MKGMKLTLVHPCIGRRAGDDSYIRTWQMEPLPPALIAGLTPPDVEVRFYDDRMERIPFDEPTDLVAIRVETYTARRAYQIATEYRRRGVPVVMGGFHASLCPDEVARYAEAVVVGEAEALWPEVIDDWRHGTAREDLPPAGARPPSRGSARTGRSSAASATSPSGWSRPGAAATSSATSARCRPSSAPPRPAGRRTRSSPRSRRSRASKTLFFFVDDNITSNLAQAKEFFRALIPLKIRWVSQASINAAHDEEFLDLLERSGCQGVLIGFESLEPREPRAP